MRRVVDFEMWHARELESYLQPQQQGDQQYMTEQICQEMIEHGIVRTALDDDVVLGFAGIMIQWPGRAIAFAYLSSMHTKAQILFGHRAVKDFLDGCYIKRIEMHVDCDHIEGHRWARLLGFTMEAKQLVGYRPGGGDCSLYARIRDGRT